MKQSEKIDKIFYAIFGMNGDDGLMKRQAKTEIVIDALFKKLDHFITNRASTCPVNIKGIVDRLKLTNAVKIFISLAGWATLLTKIMGWW